MDVSQTYIKMCEKAREIQRPWQPKEGDFVFYYDGCFSNTHNITSTMLSPYSKGYERESFCEVMANTKHWMKRKGNKFDLLTGIYIYLPRQDQLQEMINPNSNIQLSLHHLIAVADFWVGRDLQSMEQLWLAFVMAEKYHKRWDMGDWLPL